MNPVCETCGGDPDDPCDYLGGNLCRSCHIDACQECQQALADDHESGQD